MSWFGNFAAVRRAPASEEGPDPSRRRFLVGLGVAGGLAVVAPMLFRPERAEAALVTPSPSLIEEMDAAPEGPEDVELAQYHRRHRRGRHHRRDMRRHYRRGRRHYGGRPVPMHRVPRREIGWRCRNSRRFRLQNRRLCHRFGW